MQYIRAQGRFWIIFSNQINYSHQLKTEHTQVMHSKSLAKTTRTSNKETKTTRRNSQKHKKEKIAFLRAFAKHTPVWTRGAASCAFSRSFFSHCLHWGYTEVSARLVCTEPKHTALHSSTNHSKQFWLWILNEKSIKCKETLAENPSHPPNENQFLLWILNHIHQMQLNR